MSKFYANDGVVPLRYLSDHRFEVLQKFCALDGFEKNPIIQKPKQFYYPHWPKPFYCITVEAWKEILEWMREKKEVSQC